MTSPRLQAVALACERDWRLLFEGLELDLGSGTLLQVAGPNGSGKTSLIRLVPRFYEPSGGVITLDGVALDDYPLADLVARHARTHGPFTAEEVATRLGLGVSVVRLTLQRLAAQGRVLDGEFRPAGSGSEWRLFELSLSDRAFFLLMNPLARSTHRPPVW